MINEFKTFINDKASAREQQTMRYIILQVKKRHSIMVLTSRNERTMKLKMNSINFVFDFFIQTYSYVSVIELGNYLAGKSDEDPYQNPHVRARLYPELPRTEYICFYPMDKRRNETYNWYMLPMEERKKLMYNHGMIGRQYAGKIKQFITGSVGFDDFEWGVTLFSDDVLQFKKIVYEMRFDETTARYGEFGGFYIGHILKQMISNTFCYLNLLLYKSIL